jgi:hypothetical protein
MLVVAYLTCAAAIGSEVIVLILTWIKTYGQWRESRRLKMPVSLSTLLLRDGKKMIFTSLPVLQYLM